MIPRVWSDRAAAEVQGRGLIVGVGRRTISGRSHGAPGGVVDGLPRPLRPRRRRRLGPRAYRWPGPSPRCGSRGGPPRVTYIGGAMTGGEFSTRGGRTFSNTSGRRPVTLCVGCFHGPGVRVPILKGPGPMPRTEVARGQCVPSLRHQPRPPWWGPPVPVGRRSVPWPSGGWLVAWAGVTGRARRMRVSAGVTG